MISDPNSMEFKQALDSYITGGPDYKDEEDELYPPWMLTREECNKAIDSLPRNHTYGDEEEAKIKAQARKLLEWLLSTCEEHFGDNGEERERLRMCCPKCLGELCREVGLDG